MGKLRFAPKLVARVDHEMYGGMVYTRSSILDDDSMV
jgi:hypothetical protein